MMDVPFIKLFHTPNSAYFLDVNKNEILPISENSFQYLRAVLANGTDGVGIPEELIELKDLGYLTTESNVKEVRHPYTDFLDLFLERKIGKITLQLTQNCNFRCKYCVYTEKPNSRQRTHSSKRMSWDIARSAIDFLWNHSIDSPQVNIGFYGGEPLLEFPLIKRVVLYSEKRFFGKDLTFNITCNGTLLKPDMIKFFQKHNISLMISLDGPKEINDRNRVFANGRGTFDAVTRQIAMVRQVAPEFSKNLQISMVLDPQNDFDCINNIFLEEKDFDALSVQPTLVDHELDDQETIFSEEYIWKYRYQHFLAILAYFKRFPEKDISPITKQAIASAVSDFEIIGRGAGLMALDVPSGPCIPGQMRLFIDVSGNLFPCERVSETSLAMCIGTLKTGFNLSKAIHLLNVGQLTESDCRRCWCFRYCIQCAKKSDDESSFLSADIRRSHCVDTRSIAESKILQFLLFKEASFYYGSQIRTEALKGEIL